MLRALTRPAPARPPSGCSLARHCALQRRTVPSSLLLRRSSAAMASASPPPRVVAVVSPADNPALAAMPTVEGVEFIVANDVATFCVAPRLGEAEALMFLPPASPALLPELWPHVPNVKWFHSFFAGVDSLSGFMPTLVEAGVPLSNGRGAFSVTILSRPAALSIARQHCSCRA
jgi:hypothetical protein